MTNPPNIDAIIAELSEAPWPNREMDYLIAETVGAPECLDLSVRIPEYTASLDAAMTLIDSASPSDVLHEAQAMLGKRFALHMTFWPTDKRYSEWLARYVCIAALRVRSALIGEVGRDG